MRTGHALAAFLSLFAAAAVAQASTLDLVRQRLTQLPGSMAVSGKIDVAAEEFDAKQRESRNATAEFDCDPTVLRLSVAGRDLAQSADKKEAHKSLIEMSDLWARLNSGPHLLRMLRRATLLNEQPAAWKGLPARRLELKIERDASDDPPKMMKLKIEETNVLWVAPDGTPLASEQHGNASMRLLVISAKASGGSTTEYAVTGDRLIAVREIEESTSSGMGQSGQEKKTTTVTLRK